MPRISLTILSPAREFIDIIPDPWEVKYLDEVKGDCSGSFKVPFDYKRLVDTPAIKQKRNVVQVVVDGKVEGAWLMRNWHVVLSGSEEKAALYWEFSGPGLREWLHDALVYPASVFHAVSQPLPNDAQVIEGASPDNSGVITGTTTSGGGTTTTGVVSVDYIGTYTPQDAGTAPAPVIVTDPPASNLTTMRGINSAGGEFATWHFDSQVSFNYLASRGVKLIRLPIGWEHVQPSLGGALDSTSMGGVTAALDRINAAGMKAIVDLHNYGRYAISGSDQILGQGVVTDDHFIDVWTRLVNALKSHPAVLGWGLMNEPHDLYSTSLTFAQRAALWRTATNDCVQAIRATGDTHVITVMEMAIYSVNNWATWNPNKWITDPLNDREKIWYEQHIYQDANRGGKYPDSYATELSKAQSAGYTSILDRAMDWLQPWLDWLSNNNVRGFIGEYGVPCDTDASSWSVEAGKMLSVFDTHSLHYTWWGVGEWFHQYTLAPYVQPATNSGALSIARPPVSTVLENHLN